MDVDPNDPDLKLPDGATLAGAKVLDIKSVVEDQSGDERREDSNTKVTFALQAEVLFGKDSAKLGGESKARIAGIAEEIRAQGATRVRVFGFTDNLGSSAHGDVLSKKRANAVQQVLSQELNDADITYEVRGYGEQYPIADNSTESGRKKNRRVEVSFRGRRTDVGGSRRAVGALLAVVTALAVAGCGTGADDGNGNGDATGTGAGKDRTGHASSTPDEPPATPATSAAPEASPSSPPPADGRDVGACADGDCDVAVSAPVTVRFEGPAGKATLTVTEVGPDKIEYTVKSGNGVANGGASGPGNGCVTVLRANGSGTSCGGVPDGAPGPQADAVVIRLATGPDGTARLHLVSS